MKTRKLMPAIVMLLISAVLLSTASFAWVAMNTTAEVDGVNVQAYSDSLFLEISKDDSTYTTSVDLATGEKTLRFVTYGLLKNGVTVTPTAASGTAVADTKYYKKGDANLDTYAGNNYIYVDLDEGDDVTGYYTLVASAIDASALDTVSGEVYVANGNDYMYVNSFDGSGGAKDYLYWGRAYSTSLTDGQDEATLGVIKVGAPENYEASYYHHSTVWIRSGNNTNDGENLRIESVNVNGAAAGTISDALRILFVVSSDADDKDDVVALYDVGVGKFVESDATSMPLYDEILGDEAEKVKVDMYFYYDGTDDFVSNDNVATGDLANQEIEVKFAINNHEYNEP